MKKFLSILLVIAMCISSIAILASCGDPKDPAESPNTPDNKNPDDHKHSFVEGKCECGETDPDYEPPHEHSFVEGKCECGATDPEYVPPHEHNFVDGKCECGELDPSVEIIPVPDPDPIPEDEAGTMIYYQNFNDITGADTAAILAALGWKDNINYDGKGGTGTAKTDGQNAVFKKGWANTGLSTNLSVLSIDNGRLKIDNKTNNPNGAYATFVLQDAEYMTKAIAGNFTIQYNIAYETDTTSDYMWAGFVMSEGLGGTRANWNGTFARIYANGRAEAMTQSGHAYKTVANGALSGTVVEAANVCTTLFGDGADTMKGQNITVRIVYVKTAEEGSELSAGMHIFVKKAGTADFTLISSTTNKTFKGALTFALGGSFDNDQGSANSIMGDLAWRQNTTNAETEDGYAAYYTLENDASGVVYIDDIAVWVGTGNVPKDKTTTAYTGQ